MNRGNKQNTTEKHKIIFHTSQSNLKCKIGTYCTEGRAFGGITLDTINPTNTSRIRKKHIRMKTGPPLYEIYEETNLYENRRPGNKCVDKSQCTENRAEKRTSAYPVAVVSRAKGIYDGRESSGTDKVAISSEENKVKGTM